MTDARTVARPTIDTVESSPPVARSVSKRTLDLSIALFALLVLAPLLLVVALGIYLEDGGPVLFRQRRTGLNGTVFTILKFRSMTVAEDGDVVRQAAKADARVTKIGAIIRTLSIDELPQLLNVCKGEMSLVGPRPHAVAHDQRWAQLVPGYCERFRTRPGLTGYAQVTGLRGEIQAIEDLKERVAADNLYIEQWSMKLEIQIILRTVPLLFNDPNAY